MAHTITNRCTQCGDCVPQCSQGAIKLEGGELWIDPMLCNDCEGIAAQPQCVATCSIDLPPMPLQAKKGRCKTSTRVSPSPVLFANGQNHPFASAIVVWEACNLLAQRQALPWQTDAEGRLFYERQVNRGGGTLTFRLAPPESNTPLDHKAAQNELAGWDVRSACLHLIYAAYACALEAPWEQEFVISDQQIEQYLGLDKRKDLSKLAKLTLIQELVQRPCQIQLDLTWEQQGKVCGFQLTRSRLWHLLEVQRHFQKDHLGCKHLTGLTFRVRAGDWSKYFLNRQAARAGTGFYQYSRLPKSVLRTVSSIWQQHEGATRVLLWLLFRTKMGAEQRLTVTTFMRIAYGEDRVMQTTTQREERKRLLRTFESDLEVLHHYGLKPLFDPITYPAEIQPLWIKLADLPDDAEQALEFWIQDGSRANRLTDAAPRDKWQRLMQARFLRFDLPQDWDNPTPRAEKQQSTRRRKPAQTRGVSSEAVQSLSNQQIAAARKSLRLSQRDLASQMGKSQSWVRDIESGRLQVGARDRLLLLKILGIQGTSSF